MCRLYLAFKPVSSPFPQALFRAENIKFINATCFAHDWFSSYNFSADLASHIRLPNKEMVLSCIKPFLKAGGTVDD